MNWNSLGANAAVSFIGHARLSARDGDHKLCFSSFTRTVARRMRNSVALALRNPKPHSHADAALRSLPMTQTTNRFFDEAAKLMNDAAGVASGVRREFDTVMRTQAERILRDLDVVQREEFEAVKEMSRLAREENEALKARIAALEAKLGGS
jgi:BMFP domain-containing protein YqiC